MGISTATVFTDVGVPAMSRPNCLAVFKQSQIRYGSIARTVADNAVSERRPHDRRHVGKPALHGHAGCWQLRGQSRLNETGERSSNREHASDCDCQCKRQIGSPRLT
jgi:hypothetical protein